jgi:ribose transport system permease protein
LAGVVVAGTLGAFQASQSPSYLLPAFAAAFLGSTVVKPGRFNPWGSVIAIYFLITGITGLVLLGLSGWINEVFYGAALVVAVSVSTAVRRHVAARELRTQRRLMLAQHFGDAPERSASTVDTGGDVVNEEAASS